VSVQGYVFGYEFQETDVWCGCPNVAGTLPLLTVLTTTDANNAAAGVEGEVVHVTLAHWTGDLWEMCSLNHELDLSDDEVDDDGAPLLSKTERKTRDRAGVEHVNDDPKFDWRDAWRHARTEYRDNQQDAVEQVQSLLQQEQGHLLLEKCLLAMTDLDSDALHVARKLLDGGWNGTPEELVESARSVSS
jgi:hypothetical protein